MEFRLLVKKKISLIINIFYLLLIFNSTFFLAAAMTCFEKDVQALNNHELGLKMIDANRILFDLTNKFKFSLPFFKLLPNFSANWKKLVEAEDFFYK